MLETNDKVMNTNVLYCGDCMKILQGFPDESVDLIYLDPPFFSNQHYEVIWGNHAEKRAFGDRWKGGIMHYINWMSDRLEQCHRVLKKTGSIYLHCDWHAVYHLKIMMDRIFGENNFQAEIIWKYFGPTSTHNNYPRKHDNILFYTRGSKWTFNQNAILVGYDEKAIKRYDKVDKEGRRYKMYYEKDGKERKAYMKEGRPSEVFEIPFVQGTSKERLGYPTQKPEALLDIFIKASSNEGDIVLDPFVGGGTTIAVAEKNKRKWIGIDVSPTACKLAEKRLKDLGVKDIVILGLPTSIHELHALPPFEFQNWVCKQLNGRSSDRKSGDMGIDGYTLDGTPIQVKQSGLVGRNVVDNFETAIRRAGKKKGVIVAFDFVKGTYEEVAEAKNREGLQIKLLEVAEMLKSDFNPNELF